MVFFSCHAQRRVVVRVHVGACIQEELKKCVKAALCCHAKRKAVVCVYVGIGVNQLLHNGILPVCNSSLQRYVDFVVHVSPCVKQKLDYFAISLQCRSFQATVRVSTYVCARFKQAHNHVDVPFANCNAQKPAATVVQVKQARGKQTLNDFSVTSNYCLGEHIVVVRMQIDAGFNQDVQHVSVTVLGSNDCSSVVTKRVHVCAAGKQALHLRHVTDSSRVKQ